MNFHILSNFPLNLPAHFRHDEFSENNAMFNLFSSND